MQNQIEFNNEREINFEPKVGMIFHYDDYYRNSDMEKHYFIITKITKCYYEVESLGMKCVVEKPHAKDGGYQNGFFRLYRLRKDKETGELMSSYSHERKPRKFLKKKIDICDFCLRDATTKKYKLINLTTSYPGYLDYGY